MDKTVTVTLSCERKEWTVHLSKEGKAPRLLATLPMSIATTALLNGVVKHSCKFFMADDIEICGDTNHPYVVILRNMLEAKEGEEISPVVG